MQKGEAMNGYGSGVRAHPATNREISDLHYREEGKLSFTCCFILSVTAWLFSLLVPMLFGNSQTNLEIWSWAMAVACVLFAWVLVKKIRWTFLVVLICLMFVSFSGTPLIPAILLGAIVGVCAYSALVCACGRRNLLFVIVTPLLIYFTSWVLTLDPIRSLYSLAFIIPALALGLASLAGSDLNKSVLICTVATIVPMVALFAISTYSRYGGLSLETMTSAATDVRSFFEDFAKEYVSFVGKTEITEAIRSEIAEAVNSYVNLAPGLIVAVCLALSFVIHSLKNDLLEKQGYDQKALVRSRTFSVSAVTALLFLISHIMSFTTDAANKTTFLAVVFGNVSFMLIPALALVGMASIASLNKKIGILSVFVFAFLIFVLFNATSSFFILVALIGAFAVILRNIDSWAKDYYGKGDNR